MRRALSTIAIFAFVLGCEYRKHKPEGEPETKDTAMTTTSPPATTLTPEQLAELRALVIANSTLFERPDLTPTDPAVVDRFVIEALYEGKYPVSKSDRDYYLNQGKTRLTNWLSYDKDGLAYLMKRIAERWAHPVITRDGDLVRIDAGVVPGEFSVYRARLQVMKSPLLDNNELIASEVVKFLKAGMAAHPDAKTYQVEVDLPATWSKGKWAYRYDRAEDAVRMYSDDWPDKYYVTGKTNGNLDSVGSLSHQKMTEMPMDQRPVRSTQLPQTTR